MVFGSIARGEKFQVLFIICGAVFSPFVFFISLLQASQGVSSSLLSAPSQLSTIITA